VLRIRILQTPSPDEIDGIDLSQYTPGQVYEVGNLLGSYLLLEGWAEPAAEGELGSMAFFSEHDPFADVPFRDPDAPPNLSREHYPPYLSDRPDVAFDFARRHRRRK